MSGRIFVFGSINLDLIAKTSRIPSPGETVPGSNFSTAAGGKGANQALAARRAGADVVMCGAVGRDDFAKQALELLQSGGVNLAQVLANHDTTGVAIILVDEEGENVITVVPAANGTLTPELAHTMLQDFGAQDILMCQQEVPPEAVATALDICAQRGGTSLLNIAPIIPQTAELAQKADIIIANETEFALLVDQELTIGQVPAAAQQYGAQSGKTIYVTLGGDGAILVVKGEVHHVPAMPISPIDTVGAGDTFCGYLAVALLEGQDPKAALQRASVAGSLACLNEGAQPAIPQAADVESALANLA